MSDWYDKTVHDVLKFISCNTLLRRYYGGSLYATLRSVYPYHKWEGWRFSRRPNYLWRTPPKLDPNPIPYNTTNTKTQTNPPNTDTDPLDLVSSSCDRSDVESKFPNLDSNSVNPNPPGSNPDKESVQGITDPHPGVGEGMDFEGYHEDVMGGYLKLEVMQEWVNYMSCKLDLKDLSDWYRVSRQQVKESHGSYGVYLYGGLPRVLQRVYPDYPWDPNSFQMGPLKRARQRWLLVSLKKIFKRREIKEEHQFPLLFISSRKFITVDAFLPQLSLAVEYQGEHHFKNLLPFGDCLRYQYRDKEKKQVLDSISVALLIVPYWWDGTTMSLKMLLRYQHPLLQWETKRSYERDMKD
eukprot:TRINITY_DN4995_c0_g1_i1.p1 TRINITY_DN4995_c0_g1~~TRINITY_DN4995_c0_g1_i1.p1  ORF type:complete len:353 (-),score=54.94 TRINITY_DN4995_c0_g1_i1:62-1120(-)